MLQAYCDESVKDGILVIAGYVATAERWAAFSDKWAQMLSMRSPHMPRIDEFHMTEMRGTPERRELTEAYYRIIEEHVDLAIAYVIDLSELNAAIDSLPLFWREKLKEHRNPYLVAFRSLIPALATLHAQQSDERKDSGPTDFIFDEHSGMAACLNAWESWCVVAPPALLKFHGDAPIFRKSHTTLPLQAADLLAWWVRDWSARKLTLEQIAELPFDWSPKRKINVLYGRLGRDDFLRKLHCIVLFNQIINAGYAPISGPHALFSALMGRVGVKELDLRPPKA